MAHPAPPVTGATVAAGRSPAEARGTGVAEVVENSADAWRAADTHPDLAAYLPDSPAIRRVSLIEDIPAVIVPLRVLRAASAMAFIGVYWLFRMLEKDLAALERLAAGRR
ncbi:hypothetical protein [Nocardia abscessus]|uniref:hypothetical protein n=1 Tax=Nocardia abscessus TaxID=120957 RepID=UPI0024575B6F|nr:hypothetical protein [Nocardia abscessus]